MSEKEEDEAKIKKDTTQEEAHENFTDHDFRNILKRYWGYDDFRGIQLDIIRHITSRKDTLGLMPTGGGKSITFQVPGLLMKGVCLVISPLIALMKDQVMHLRKRGIMATALYSGMSSSDLKREIDNCIYGAYQFLYISPERLSSPSFREHLKRISISFVTVDEAHCISQWGYDFRPPYLEIANIRELFPDIPILALTATATPLVVEDICRCLQFRTGYEIFRMSFERCNLSYVVRHANDKLQEMLHILHCVSGSAIIYTRNRKETREISKWLKQEGITSTYFHAGLSNLDKDVRQHMWQDNDVRVIVATNAFGMGIDKPDVRLVIHTDVPDSIEAYFQEAGRAGRDGQKAWAVLLTNGRDAQTLQQRIVDTFPDREYIRKVYDSLCYYFELALGDGFQTRYEFDLERFCITFKFFPIPMMSALQLLCRAGYLAYDENENAVSRMQMIISREELYSQRMILEEDRVLQYIMRHYTGIFSEYIYIDESRIANDLQLSRHTVYQSLLQLNRQRILHYVPRKDVPYITFLTRRILSKNLTISQEIYEDRRNDFEKRVEAMTHYFTSSNECRSKLLLLYFGEQSSHDCGHCDVCIEKKKTASTLDTIKKDICHLLLDAHLPPQAIRFTTHSESDIAQALNELIEDNTILLKEGKYILMENRKKNIQ